MIKAISKCQICQEEKDLTKEELIDLINDCDSQERFVSFVLGISKNKDRVQVPVMCPECAKEMNLNSQQ